MNASDRDRLGEEVRELTRHHRALHRLLGDLRGAGRAGESLYPGVERGLHGRPAQDGDAKQ